MFLKERHISTPGQKPGCWRTFFRQRKDRDMKELIVLLNDLTQAQESLKLLGVHVFVGLKPTGGASTQKPQRSLATKPMKAATSAEKILETAAASAANGKVSRASLINEVRSQWNLSGPQIGQGLRSLCVHKYMKFDSVSGIYKIL